MDDKKRETIKRNLLCCLAESDNISLACKTSGVSRETYYQWLSEGYISQHEIIECFKQFCDNLLNQAYQRAVDGEEVTLLSSGRVIKDSKGKPMTVRKKNDRMLQWLIENKVPGFKPTTESGNNVNVNVLQQQTIPLDDIPAAYAIRIDSRLLTGDELTIIMRIAEQIEARDMKLLSN